MTSSDARDRDLARISEQLEDLRRLMIVQLLASGVQSAHIAKTLGIHSSGISRIVPAREIQKLAKRSKRDAEADG